jgi:NitT/TauT family transport system permease protein
MIERWMSSRWRLLIPFIALLAVWWWITFLQMVPPVFLPAPDAVIRSLLVGFVEGTLLYDTLVSCGRIFMAFSISLLIALPLGFLFGLSSNSRAYLEPLNDFIRYVPVPAIVPLIILWFGLGNSSQVAVIVFGTLPQLLVMVADAVSRLPNHFQEMCRSLHLTKIQTLRHAVVPYSSPQIYDGSRVAIGWAWSYLLVAEIVGANHGLGQSLIVAQRFLQTPRVVAVIILVALIGLAIDTILRKLYPTFYPWVSEIRHST